MAATSQKSRAPFFQRLRRAFSAAHAVMNPKPLVGRGFAGADVNRLNIGWTPARRHVDEEVRSSIGTLRARARSLFQDNPYLKRFTEMLAANVLGPDGMPHLKPMNKDAAGTLDTETNKAIREAFLRWAQSPVTVDGRMNFQEFRVLALQTAATDGECLVRIHRGYPFNPFGFGLQFIDADQVDETRNTARGQNQNEIRMGIEIDAWGRPIAYWIRNRLGIGGGWSIPERVDAADIKHIYRSFRPNQTRGVTWCHAILSSLGMLDGYEEAALVAARIAAAMSGFFTTDRGPDEEETEEDKARQPLIMEVQPGLFRELPRGVGFQQFDPKHPAAGGPDLVKQWVRRISTGLSVFFNTLANDAESTSYSSARHFRLIECDDWRMLQEWWAAKFETPLYREWLGMAVLSGQLRIGKFDPTTFSDHAWRFRGWMWVDPLRDVQATAIELDRGLTSPFRVISEQGRDPEDVLQEWKEWFALLAKHGISINATPLTTVNDTYAQGEDPSAQSNPATTNGNGTGSKALINASRLTVGAAR